MEMPQGEPAPRGRRTQNSKIDEILDVVRRMEKKVITHNPRMIALPIRTPQDMQISERYLMSNLNYHQRYVWELFTYIVGKNEKREATALMRAALSSVVATLYSLTGGGGKLRFETTMLFEQHARSNIAVVRRLAQKISSQKLAIGYQFKEESRRNKERRVSKEVFLLLQCWFSQILLYISFLFSFLSVFSTS